MKDVADFPAAIMREIQSRFEQFQRGIQMYHAHPFRRAEIPAQSVWEQGTTKLYDYGGPDKNNGAPLLVIPSLVNRAYILDLLPEKSFMRYLSSHGFRPLLVDWGEPAAAEKDFGLSDYVQQRLLPIYDFVQQKYNTPSLIGYCMGGNLAFALASLVQQKPTSLVLMATPWDFHAQGMPKFTHVMADQLLTMVKHTGELSVDWLQGFFTALDPFGSVEKFMRFAEKDMDGASARMFVALEDWLSDGVPLTQQVAEDTMRGWYAENAPMRGGWKIMGQNMLPESIKMPTLAVLPQADRIVSPASSLALAGRIPGALSLSPHLGHIGMMVSRDSEKLVWEPVAAWLKEKAK